MSFNKQDLIWSDDVDSLESTFFWWEEPEDGGAGESDEGDESEEDDEDGDEIEGQQDVEEEDDSVGESSGAVMESEMPTEEPELFDDIDEPEASEESMGGGAAPTSAYARFARYGPGEKAVVSDLKFDRTISTFVSRLPSKQGKNIQPYGIHGTKAAICLVAYPHKILEQKKTRKADPSIYVVVDSYSSYYPDRGAFLNLFASTCERLKIQTWRAEKLVNNFECNKLGRKFRGQMLKCEWARKAGIEPGSTVVFVGDGCNGNVGDGYWLNSDLIAFKKLYNPIWVSRFAHGSNCGCQSTRQTEWAGWKMYHGIIGVNDIKNTRI